MTTKHRLKHRLSYLLVRALFILPLIMGWIILALLLIKTTSPLPVSLESRKNVAMSHLWGLRHQVREQNAAERMQEIFPEGACFTITLYGLAWTNLLANFEVESELRDIGIAEVYWALEQYKTEAVKGPFASTQVRNGVFWLGQRNLVIGQLLKVLPEHKRPSSLVQEFHENSESLAQAFLNSPTFHLDSYSGYTWPADNVTALASILLHDELYGTEYRIVFNAWKEWTQKHSDPLTGLPAGHLDSQTGELLQPSRGCANSWILALLPQMDGELARKWYAFYQKHFLIQRFGISMFREYPEGFPGQEDIDSGPIILGAGVTATGVGLATSIANGDLKTAEDIWGLSSVLGLKRNLDLDGKEGVQYLLGLVPVGDAFLTWAHTLIFPKERISKPQSISQKLWKQKILVLIFLAYGAVVLISIRSFARKLRDTH